MNRLMTAARARKIDCIACWKIDRWGRSMPHFVNSVQELRSLGVRFIAITQGIDTDESNPTAKLMLNLLVAFSEFEREFECRADPRWPGASTARGRIGGRKPLVVDRERIGQLDELGYSTREIGEEMGVSASSICRLLKTHRLVIDPKVI
jgi:DNA invertase Pin-like site-specific DNA recombinase